LPLIFALLVGVALLAQAVAAYEEELGDALVGIYLGW